MASKPYVLMARGTFEPPCGSDTFDAIHGKGARLFTLDHPFLITAPSLESAIEALAQHLNDMFGETVTNWVVYEA